MLTDISELVPDFGGLFFEPGDTQTLHVYLQDASKKSAVEDAIASVMGASSIPKNGIKVHYGRYGFKQLAKWYDEFKTLVWSIPGVSLSDINEATNRIEIGVLTEEAKATVEARLVGLGVPQDSFSVFVEPPRVQQATLTSQFRPIDGGIMIQTDTAVICSMGVMANRSGTIGFLTASHCTHQTGGVDSTPFYQPVPATDHIGNETVDPTWLGGISCPTATVCRNSDSAFATFDAGLSYNFGYIARPLPNSTTIDSANPRFRIVGRYTPRSGDTISFVGKSSGLKTTTISRTCVDSSYSGLTIYCATETPNVTQGGDSGGAWFQIVNSPNQGDVLFAGIHAAGGLTSVFSPIGQVEKDLGALKFCAAPYNC